MVKVIPYYIVNRDSLDSSVRVYFSGCSFKEVFDFINGYIDSRVNFDDRSSRVASVHVGSLSRDEQVFEGTLGCDAENRSLVNFVIETLADAPRSPLWKEL